MGNIIGYINTGSHFTDEQVDGRKGTAAIILRLPALGCEETNMDANNMPNPADHVGIFPNLFNYKRYKRGIDRMIDNSTIIVLTPRITSNCSGLQ